MQRSYDGGYSKGKLEIHDKSRFKKMFSTKGPPNVPKVNKDRVPNPNQR